MSDRLSGAAATDESRAAARVGGGETLYEIRDLTKHFPLTSGMIFRKQVGAVHAVDGVSFDVKRGETLGLVGESGCGKSTTARLVIGLIQPDAGSIILDGEKLGTSLSLRDLRRRVQMVFQDSYASLNPRLTIEASIAFGPIIHGVSSSEARERAPLLGPHVLRQLAHRPGLAGRHLLDLEHERPRAQQQRRLADQSWVQRRVEARAGADRATPAVGGIGIVELLLQGAHEAAPVGPERGHRRGRAAQQPHQCADEAYHCGRLDVL